MIIAYNKSDQGIVASAINKDNADLIRNALWIDLISPNRKEEKLVEQHLNLDVPTKKEMQEIEPSSRLYTDNNILFMTVMMVAQSDTPHPKADAVTFILTETQLITVRYIEPHAFKVFIARLVKPTKKIYDSAKIFIGLLDSSADRLADILENVSHKFEDISLKIFHQNNNGETNPLDYKHILQEIGVNGELGSKVRESLVSFIRLVSFLEQTAGSALSEETRTRLSIISRDISALSDYAGFISTKVNFLLDATLGMVNIDQNNIIKIFSVAAVIFLPPTLVASIYGMNFMHMPELNWKLGYPVAIGLMILAAWLPYRYFKKRKWL